MAKMKSFSEYLNPTPEVIVEDVMKPSLGKASSTTEQSNFMESFSKNYEAFTQNVEKAEQFIEKFNELAESVKPNENLIERGEVESILATHLLIINQNIQEIKKDLLGINESDLSKITDVISSIDARTETLIEFVQAELPKNKSKLYELSLNLDKKVALLSAEISDVEETTAATFESVSRKLAEAEAATEEQFKLSDEVKVKILAKVNALYEDLHTTNDNIGLLSENYDEVLLPAIARINAFEENLSSVGTTVNDYYSKLDETKEEYFASLVQTKEELKQVINEVNAIFVNEKYVELDRKVERIEEIFDSINAAQTLNEELGTLTPEELKTKTAEEVEKYLSGKSFQQPNPEMVSTSPEFKNIALKLKFLEQAIGRIAATGPGGGEVNLRYLDDVDRSSIQDGRFLKYDAETKKFVFSAIDLSALNYQGVWDALANSPALATGTGTKGYYYIVGTAGTTALDGISDWKIGDWVVFSGTEWQKIDNTDSVTSVNGQTGPVVLGTMSDQNANAVAITGGSITVKDNVFTLQDNLDPTKQAQFQLSGLLTSTTYVYTLPTSGSGASTLVDLNSSQTISATKSFSSPNQNVGSSTGTGTQQFAYGATLSGNTKTVLIGTAGLSGSTTNITVGATAGASTTTMYGQIDLGGTTTSVNFARITGAATGAAPTISAQGSDANINLSLQAKGTGSVVISSASITGGSISGTSITVADNVFTLQDNIDPTKQAQFQVSAVPTGTTVVYNLPYGTTNPVLLGALNIPNTWTSGQTFSASTGAFGTSVAASTYSVASGATTTGLTKTVNIGTGGLSGSTTAIAIGSSVSGATSTTTMNGITNFLDTGFTLQDDADTTKQARFQLSGLLTAQTTVYTLPVGFSAASLLLDAPSTQTINGIKTFSSATQNVGSSTAASTQQFAYGATTTGNTKTVNVGTGGLFGSTTNITIGSGLGTSNTTFTGTNYFGGAVGNHSLQVGNIASAVNFLEVRGATTNNIPGLYAGGSDGSVNIGYFAKAGGYHFFYGSDSPQLAVIPTSSSVNYVGITGGATTVAPTVSAQSGTDTNVGLNLTSKGFGVINVNTGTGTVAKFQDRGVTTVNSPFIFRAGLAGTTAGVLTFPVSPMLQSPDTSDFMFNTNAGTGGGQSGFQQVVLGHTTSAVNYLRLTGAATGAAPSISALGSDTHISLSFRTKNAGAMVFTKQRDATVNSTYLFENGGGLTNDGSGGAFWRGFHIGAPNYTVSGANKYPRIAQYFELQSATDPTYKNAYLTIGNAGGENIEFNFANEAGGWSFRNSSSVGTDKTFRVATPLITDKNYLQVAGAAVNLAPILSAQGTDTNVSLALQSKGTGAIDLAAGSSGINISNGTSVTSVVIPVPAVGGYATLPTITFSAPTTPGGVTATVSPIMTAWGYPMATGGTLYTVGDILTLVGGTFSNQVIKFRVATVSTGGVVTGVTVSQYGNYSALPANPVSVTGGTGSGATITIAWSIAGTVSLVGGSGYVEQPTITISGTGGATAYAIVGSQPIIKSIGSSIAFNTPGGTQLRIADTNAVNYWQATGSAAGGGVIFGPQGTDTNIYTFFDTKGNEAHGFRTGGGQQVRITNTASAVNYLQLTGAGVGTAPIISTGGSDTNIGLNLSAKGSGSINAITNGGVVNLSNGSRLTGIVRNVLGTVYTSPPTVAISAPTIPGGVQATAVSRLQQAGATIVSGGTGYTVGDLLTIVGGTLSGQVVRFQVTAVSSGVITTIDPFSLYGDYLTIPSNPVSVTGGTGTGATFNLTWLVFAYTITNAGSGYSEQPTITVSGGGGSGATAYALIGSSTTLKTIGSNLILSTPGGPQVYIADTGGITTDYVYLGGSYFGRPGVGAKTITGSGNASLMMFAQGTGGTLQFSTNNSAQKQVEILHTASAVNFLTMTGAATTGSPTITGAGSDTNVGLTLSMKGWSSIQFYSTTGGQLFQIGQTTSTTANFFQALGNSTGNAPTFSAQGSDANVGLVITGKGTGSLVLSGTATSRTVQIDPVASGTTTYTQFTKNAAINEQQIIAAGTANLCLAATGGGAVNIRTAATSQLQVVVSNTASVVNYLNLTGSPTGGGFAPTISSLGSDTNINLLITGKGTGSVYLGSAGNAGGASLVASPMTSSVNYVQVLGAATGNTPQLLAGGQDSSINLSISAKTNGSVNISNGNGTSAKFYGGSNNFAIAGAPSGSGPEISAQGSDVDIDLKLTPKGTGVLNITATPTAAAGAASTHKIPVKINGVTYYILVSNV